MRTLKTVTAGIGVATDTAGPVSPATLLASADERLSAAERAGRDRVIGEPVRR